MALVVWYPSSEEVEGGGWEEEEEEEGGGWREGPPAFILRGPLFSVCLEVRVQDEEGAKDHIIIITGS